VGDGVAIEKNFHWIFQATDPQLAVQQGEGLACPPPSPTRKDQHEGGEQYDQQSLQMLWLPDGIFDQQPLRL